MIGNRQEVEVGAEEVRRHHQHLERLVPMRKTKGQTKVLARPTHVSLGCLTQTQVGRGE